MLPNITIPLLNGQLGTIEPVEGKVPGMILSGVAISGSIALADPRQLFALADAEALGIDSFYDVDNDSDAWLQIKEFYDQAGTGAELYIMLVAKTATMASVCDITNNLAKKMLNYAQGRITYWAHSRMPDEDYVATTTKGFDDDAYAAILKAQALCESFASQFKPCRAIIGARAFSGLVAGLIDLHGNTDNRVMVLLASANGLYSETNTYQGTGIGLLLGRMAKTPVQEKISRVRTGDLNILNAYFSNGASVMTLENAWDAIHDKGYVFMRKFVGRNGFYFTSDPTCVSSADDYSSFARGLVIDKAMRILYEASLDEIEDDNDVDEQGFIAPAYAKSLQAKLENALLLGMANEISGAEVLIDPKQNVLATNKVQITKAGIRPKFYATYIDIPLGFSNPAT